MGFLQRVAASAMRTVPRTHPLVDSIYAAPHAAEQAASSLHVESTLHSAVPQPRGSESRAIGSNEDRRQREGESALQRTTNRVANTDIGAPQGLVEPWIQPSIGKSTTNSSSAEKLLGTLVGNTEPSLESPSTLSSESLGNGAQEEIRLRGVEYLPVVMERLFKADASNAPEISCAGEKTYGVQAQSSRKEPNVSTMAGQVNARGQQSPVSQPSRPAQPQPEEIQVHIGRIEVLAVPQTAPRQAAAPARKGLSLDEYLSRRNGRSG